MLLSEQGTTTSAAMFEDVFEEVPWHLAEQRDQALDEAEGEAQMTVDEHDPGDQQRPRGDDGARPRHRRDGRGRRLFRRRLPRHRGPAEEVRQDARVRRADHRRRDRRHRGRHGRLWPEARSPRSSSPTTSIPATTRSSAKSPGCAIAPPANGRCRWSSARPMAAASSAARRTASRPRPCSPMSPA